ncbi:unnamed protein product [Caenorhabditis nigoni]
MDQCLLKFYDEVYQANYNCTKDFDYFSQNMDMKKVAYGSGKACFLKIANDVCSEKSITYLDTKYHNLLDILTEYNPEDHCHSFHDEWMARQCQPKMNAFLKEAENPTGSVSLYDLCDNVAECWYEHCYFNEKRLAERLKGLCSKFIDENLEDEYD